MALVMGLGLTSCMDDDWKAPSGDTPAYGNNTLQEKNVISIAKLKEDYGITKDMINDTVRIDDGIQIKGVVTGNDIEGNLYNEISFLKKSKSLPDGLSADLVGFAKLLLRRKTVHTKSPVLFYPVF